MGYCLRPPTAPQRLWTMTVMTLDSTARPKSGSFSISSRRATVRSVSERDGWRSCQSAIRSRGHTSSNSRTKGSVTTIGLARSPSANSSRTAAYRSGSCRRTYATYASSVSSQKNVLSTSFRSDTQATDSTCSGWIANSAATTALRPTVPVMRRSAMNSSSVFAT